MRGKIYTIVSQGNPLTPTTSGGSQYNAYSRVQDAEAIQCQKQHRHFVVVLLLAFCFMVSLQQFKKSLGKKSELLTDEQVEKLRAAMYQVSDAFFDKWKSEKPHAPTTIVRHSQNGNCVSFLILAPLYV